MEYKKGERVRHPSQDEWGLGEVLANSNGEVVRIFFVGAGEKTISLKYVRPTKVSLEESSHPILDNLRISNSASGIRYQSLPQSIQFFLAQFPGGFYGQRFFEEEREYKEKAHTLACQLLGQEAFSALLANCDYPEIAKRALRIANSTNLIFPNEKMALKDGLATEAPQQLFAEALYNLLFAEEDLRQRFDAFSRVLENIRAAKWTTASYFLFIMHPDTFMFVKPTITQYLSELCAFEINYKPQLNWLTYKSVLDLSHYLYSEISELRPRDMIDVQSFMWCIAPGTYQPV